MAMLPLPTPEALNNAQGQTTATSYRWLQSLEQEVRGLKKERLPLSVDVAANKAYAVEIAAPYGYKVIIIQAQCTSGTCTMVWDIGGVNITAPFAVSSSLTTQTPSANNVVVAGNVVTATVSANAACVGLRADAIYIRT